MYNSDLLLNVPLKGTVFIEASAGTGKTYALTVFYLRFLLGMSEKNKFFRPFDIEEILVLTFSESVLQELKNRIRETIRLFLIDCIKGYSKNVIFSLLMKKINCLKDAIFLLLKAEKNINKASIFTIHGFCHRILKGEVYQSDFLLYKNFLEDESFVQKESCMRFWVRCSEIFSNEIFDVVQHFWKNPNNFFRIIYPHLVGETPKIYGNYNDCTKEYIIKIYYKIISYIKIIKNEWFFSKEIIRKIIKNKKISQRIYNDRNLSSWFKKIDVWVQNNLKHFYLPEVLERFKISEINKSNFLNCTISFRFFIFVENLFKEYFLFQHIFFLFSLKEIKKYIKKRKKQISAYSFNDLIEILHGSLSNDELGNNLSQIIRKKFPVVMVDEFQDIDLQQYKIFKNVYWNREDCDCILIGDPKQSIYSFRGADIFTYILARSKLKNFYVLSFNWRSSYNMNKVINYLFQSIRSPFLLKNIHYIPIRSANKNANLQFTIDNHIQPVINIWTKFDDIFHIDECKRMIINHCVKEICNLMHVIKFKRAYLEKLGEKKLLCLSDIAVIVRDNKEAKLIFNALSKANVPVIYNSNYNNVFSTLEAKEILWILIAILFPENKNALRCALSTDIFGLNSKDIQKINEEKFQWNYFLDKFKIYKSIWKNVGVLSTIKRILDDQISNKKILIDKFNEKKLINIFHICEILQEFSLENENEYSLIHWLKSRILYSNENKEKYKMRIENNYKDAINIMTIHKSKGLEFPLVFLPFSFNSYIKKRIIFHEERSATQHFDFSQDIEKMKLIRKEDFSEELRLFYVSITRSIYQCTLSVIPMNIKKTKKKDDITRFYRSAFEFLLKNGKRGDTEFLSKQLEKLKKSFFGNIACSAIFP